MSYPLERGTFSITQFLMGGGNVPKQRYQTIGSGLKQNKNGSWFIRPWVDIITADGLARVRRRIVLGPASIGKREATRLANEALAKINNASYVIQSQIALEDFAREYTKRHIRKISYSTQCKYDIHLKRIVGVFGKSMLCEITTPRSKTGSIRSNSPGRRARTSATYFRPSLRRPATGGSGKSATR